MLGLGLGVRSILKLFQRRVIVPSDLFVAILLSMGCLSCMDLNHARIYVISR